jgi:Lon protease-like protein
MLAMGDQDRGDQSPFDPSFDELPSVLGVFPLPGALLLPRGRLPLRVFEPRYLAMTLAALAGSRMIGMIQPHDGEDLRGAPSLYRTGCAGRITSFAESEDGEPQFVLTLSGVIRFDIGRELERPAGQLFRTVEPDWTRFRRDLFPDDPDDDRGRLVQALKPFFGRHKIDADFSAIEKAPPERLINTLSMICPFRPGEKQALLEARDTAERARLLTALVEMSLHDETGSDGAARH